MPYPNVAIVYDRSVRTDTTGEHCRKALEPFADVTYFPPERLHLAPPVGFDLYLNVDDGFHYPWPQHLRPCAWWVIDTHLTYEEDREKARGFDYLFTAQRDGAEKLRADGIVPAWWLPLACNPDLHRPMPVAEKDLDVAFVGNPASPERVWYLDLLRERYARHYIGNAYGDEMAEVYSRARIVFNISVRNDINMRVFEALGCGSLLITNDLAENGQDELFTPGKHLVTFTSDEELLQRIDYYLEHDDERERIAAAGHERVMAEHTYEAKMRHIVDTCTYGGEVPRDKPFGYYHFARPDLLELVPAGAKRILDFGCGAGRLGEEIRKRQPCEVWGVELNPYAAREAEQRLDHVVRGPISLPRQNYASPGPCLSGGSGDCAAGVPDGSPRDRSPEDVSSGGGVGGGAPDGKFDCIILGDVLEHLEDPWTVLADLVSQLDDGGTVVASIPNARSWDVLEALGVGRWEYRDAGVMDRGHLRYFTVEDAAECLRRAGLHIAEVQGVPGRGEGEWAAAGRPSRVEIGPLSLDMHAADAKEFLVEQFLFRATKQPAEGREPGLVSIIILCWNQLEYTRQCVEGILRHTEHPYELIFVDNGSTDETADYLAGIPGAKVITNKENLGFPKGCNQGIEAAEGDNILLLNNDTIVPPGWLGRLVELADSDDRIGLIGPVSNEVGGPQRVATAYETVAQMQREASRLARAHGSQLVDCDRLVGFCLLIKRKALADIGGLDERFGMGLFEDDDLCRRAKEEGYRLVYAPGVFVHHFGSRTFAGMGVDGGELLERNKRQYEEKWGADSSGLKPTGPESEDSGLQPDAESEDSGLQPDAGRGDKA
ncbi:MAG: glycosyltransferase, partial [Armatimonadia bacterium]|nr:glycosyltransferase [Armatimonadia bacterium]